MRTSKSIVSRRDDGDDTGTTWTMTCDLTDQHIGLTIYINEHLIQSVTMAQSDLDGRILDIFIG